MIKRTLLMVVIVSQLINAVISSGAAKSFAELTAFLLVFALLLDKTPSEKKPTESQ